MEEDNLISLFSSIMTRQQEILIYMKEIISAETNIPVESIKDTNTFFELGLDSINAVYLLELAEQKYKITLSNCSKLCCMVDGGTALPYFLKCVILPKCTSAINSILVSSQ